MSKKRIAIELGLSASVITKLCTELIQEKILIETDIIKTAKAGRNEIQITINPEFKSCIGIVMNHKITTILLTDMHLNTIYQGDFPTNSDPNQHLNTLINSLHKLIKQNNLTKEQILGIGISIKGNTDGVFAYYGIWDCKVNIRDYLMERLDIPVVLDNGIRCSAMLEQLYSVEETFVFIKYMEPGIGGAIIQDGQIKHGETHSILDFGHMIVVPDSKDYCPVCKRKGCLENIISIDRIMEYVREHFSQEFSPVLWNLCGGTIENITLENVIEAVETGCINLNALFKRNATYFAMSIINTYALLDIKKIIILGDLFSSNRFLNYFKTAIYEYQLTPIYENIEFHHHENVLLSSVVLAVNEFLF